FPRREGLIKRRLGVDVQVVLKQRDLVGMREVVVGEFLENLGVIYGGMPIRHLHVSPAFQRGEYHKEIGDAVTLVLVVMPSGASRFHGDWLARLGNQLLRRLIEADQRSLGVVRSLVDGQHILHRGDESGVRLGRNYPAFFSVGLEETFFKTRPIVL